MTTSKLSEEIYQYVRDVMHRTLPEQWAAAWLNVFINTETMHILLQERFIADENDSSNVQSFDTSALGDSLFDEAFPFLYKHFQKNKTDKPWNKCRIAVHPDGDFEVKFKLDADLEYLNALCPEDPCWPDFNTIRAIESWSGLSEETKRPWASLEC